MRPSLVIVVSLVVACGDDDGPAGADAAPTADAGAGDDGGNPDWEPDPPGRWYAGDVHVHATGASNDTGGDSFPEDIARMAQERGLSFVVLTDHSNSTGSDVTTRDEDPALFNLGPEFPYWETAAMLSVPGELLLIDGNEISPVAQGESPSTPTGHIGCLPISLDGFDTDSPFIDRPRGTVTGGDVLRQAKERGCFAVLNHPYAAAPWTAFDWTGMEYDAIEVWNGTLGYAPDDAHGYDAWRCDLLAGRDVVPIAASDNHRVNIEPPGGLLDPPLGWPSTAVFATELTWPAILDGMRAGRVAMHEGETRLYLDGYDADHQRAEGPETRWLRLRGRIDPDARQPGLTVTRTTGCDDPRPALDPPVPEDDILMDDVRIDPGTDFDLAIPIGGEPGVYSAILVTGDGHRGALSRAIVVR